MNRLYLTLILLAAALGIHAGDAPRRSLNDILQVLQASSSRSVQEKVYIHTDNNCYFIGDTLWYKAYVVRADDLHFTDMSRILYVELLNPDGLVVERQNLVVDPKGNYSCGSFALHDSLYSGFYELRAYTRWMLNFNVGEHTFGREIKYAFFNQTMARDFFRQWDGLYSRVLPVYKKPDEPGDFTFKRMYQRPKQRVMPAEKEKLLATFYPEGGHMVKGLPCRVAFELTTQEGEAVNLTGQIVRDDKPVARIQTSHMGRGRFTVTPDDKRIRVKFRYRGRDYTFKLPPCEETGATVNLTGRRAVFTASQLPTDREYGVSILCRGVLKHFARATFDAQGSFALDLPDLPTGVNDLTLFDSDGHILADRLFFVNNHDYDGYTVSVDSGMKSTYSPYEPVTLSLRCSRPDKAPDLLSVAVRDKQTDEPSYDDGDIMTDLLLGSELKGFVAHPAYYFEADDEQHRQALDLLMMVQGWRKYAWQDQADPDKLNKRYQPEVTMTVEGAVYKMTDIPNDVDPVEIGYWKYNIARIGTAENDGTEALTDDADGLEGETEQNSTDGLVEINPYADLPSDLSADEYGPIRDASRRRRTNRGGLKKEVLVEAELIVGKDVAGLTQKTTNGGRFLFQIPPYYGCAILNMKAYKERDSLKKNMVTGHDKGTLDEEDIPDYYVKRDLFYPRLAQPYGYYQNHTPDYVTPLDTSSAFTMEKDAHTLRNVTVKGKWHGKRTLDYTKPAFVADAYEIYNELTDYGLSSGTFDPRSFAIQICQYLYGNMGRYISFNVDGKIDNEKFHNYTFVRNYSNGALVETQSRGWSTQELAKTIRLKRFSDVCVYSDFEPRREKAPMEYTRTTSDATVVFHTFPNDSEQPTYRDRHIILQGFDYPQKFYSPDYSRQLPPTPSDYRRTLYWNPNLKTDAQGRAKVSFYNNCRETRISVSACGLFKQ